MVIYIAFAMNMLFNEVMLNVQMNGLPFVHCVKYKFRLKTLLNFWIEINSIPHVWVNILINCFIIWTNVFFLIVLTVTDEDYEITSRDNYTGQKTCYIKRLYKVDNWH